MHQLYEYFMYPVACLQHWLILVLIVHCAVKHCVCCLGYGAMWIGSEYQRFVGACCFLLQGGQSGTFVCMYTHTHTPVHMVSYARLLNFYYVGLDLRGFWFQSRSGIDVCLLLNGGRSCAVVWSSIVGTILLFSICGVEKSCNYCGVRNC